jgi:NAD(P)-dependent dehydrogenase (short-subunit alcohol dehydrogenase family)
MEGETEIVKLRPLLIKHLKAQGKSFKPLDLDPIIIQARNQVEVLSNLEMLKAAGEDAIYICCDVSDAESVKAAVSEGTSKFGKITGFIHGAGAIADKNMFRKTQSDFHKVYDTKTDGLKNAILALDPSSLKFISIFSSVTSYFGNVKQADYALANEICNKFVNEFRKLYPAAHAVSINWGPWEGGMVSEALAKYLTARKIAMVGFDEGAELFTNQLGYKIQPGYNQFLISGFSEYLENEIDFL